MILQSKQNPKVSNQFKTTSIEIFHINLCVYLTLIIVLIDFSAEQINEKQSKFSAESEKEKQNLLIEVEASNFNSQHKDLIKKTIETNRLYKSKYGRIKLEEAKLQSETEFDLKSNKEVNFYFWSFKTKIIYFKVEVEEISLKKENEKLLKNANEQESLKNSDVSLKIDLNGIGSFSENFPITKN